MPTPEDLRPALRRAAMDLLARREHSRRELEQKLQRRFRQTEGIAGVLDQLAQESLQSDSRYLLGFVRQRILRGYGPLRLHQEMRQKGIAGEQLECALEALAVDWTQRALDVCRKKFGENPPQDLRERGRRQRFLQYRGFESEHIRACLE
ncbi:MAG: regulatory protein RecX [Parahaliea sp.]